MNDKKEMDGWDYFKGMVEAVLLMCAGALIFTTVYLVLFTS